jgi:dTDP-4-dehydrorhamnose reductase
LGKGRDVALVKILVFGGEGMLGHKMFQALLSRYPDTACTVVGSLCEPFYRKIDLFRQGRVIEKVDAMDLSSISQNLRELRPRFLVNCIGVIKQREEAKAAIPSITLNSLLPHKLAEIAREWSGRVIHFSTDCVFSGKRGRYTEVDPSDAEDLYGKSKYLGEVASENALTLRTSIIGRELAHFRSLLEWFLGQKGKTIRGFKRVIYSGVTTNYLAELVGTLVADHPSLSGLYQVTSPSISKYDLLCMLRDAYKLDVGIVPDEQEVSDRSMVGERFLRATGYKYPKWPDLVGQLANDSTPYEKWR